MANTGSGSLATILFFFIFPAALRKGRTLADVRLLCLLCLVRICFVFLSSRCHPLLLLFAVPLTESKPHHSFFFLKGREKKKISVVRRVWFCGTMRSEIKLWNACLVCNAGMWLCVAAGGEAGVAEASLCWAVNRRSCQLLNAANCAGVSPRNRQFSAGLIQPPRTTTLNARRTTTLNARRPAYFSPPPL